MSGALTALISKGAQDKYLISENLDEAHRHFRTRYKRHSNFAQAPKLIQTVNPSEALLYTIKIPASGDILSYVWFEGPGIATNLFYKSTIDLYVGGQKIDSHRYDYLSDVWPSYLADSWTKAQEVNNKMTQNTVDFVPLHFFFNDCRSFLPLVALKYTTIEIKIHFDATVVSGLTAAQKQARCYGNYVFLDRPERERFAAPGVSIDFLIPQVQTIDHDMVHVDNNVNESGGDNIIDISSLNHPVRSLFFGIPGLSNDDVNDRFTFKEADIILNGVPLLEKMSPLYFHAVQNYFHSTHGIVEYDATNACPFYTRYYAYHFALHGDDCTPSGSVNFSRLDDARIALRGVECGSDRPANQGLTVYALSWNILRIRDGVAGILFGN